MSRSNWPTASRQSRGYGAEWDKLRLVVLKRDNGLCQCDECKGGKIRVTIAREVHHIKPKAEGGTDHPSNLQAVAHACHERISAEQQGRKPIERPPVSVDGSPIGVKW